MGESEIDNEKYLFEDQKHGYVEGCLLVILCMALHPKFAYQHLKYILGMGPMPDINDDEI